MGLFDVFSGKGRRNRFARKVVKRLHEKGWPHPIQYDPNQFTLDVGGDAGAVALHHTYAEWSKHPQRGQLETLDEAIGFIFELGPPPPFEAAAAMLRPMLRARAAFETAMPDPGGESSAFLTPGGWWASTLSSSSGSIARTA